MNYLEQTNPYERNWTNENTKEKRHYPLHHNDAFNIENENCYSPARLELKGSLFLCVTNFLLFKGWTVNDVRFIAANDILLDLAIAARDKRYATSFTSFTQYYQKQGAIDIIKWFHQIKRPVPQTMIQNLTLKDIEIWKAAAE